MEVFYKPSKLEGRPAEYQARSGLEYHNSPIGGTTMAECNDYNHHRQEEIKSCYSNPNTPPIGGIVSPQPVKVSKTWLFLYLYILLCVLIYLEFKWCCIIARYLEMLKIVITDGHKK